jgi:hypothetical protein
VGFAAALAVGAVGHAHAQASAAPASGNYASSYSSSVNGSSGGGGGSESFLKTPIFLAQPGAITVNPHNDFAREGTGFNLRLVTVIPTSMSGFQFIVGAQFQPNGTSTRLNGTTMGNFSDNRPAVFYGAVFALSPLNQLFNNWFSFSVDPLGWYQPNGGGDTHHAYGNDFFLEGAVSFNFGRKLWGNHGWVSGLSAYGLLDQQISDAPRNANGNRTYWNPNIMYGLTVPLAGKW